MKVLFVNAAWGDTSLSPLPWDIVRTQDLANKVRDWYAEVSYGKVVLEPTVFPSWVQGTSSQWTAWWPDTAVITTKLSALGCKVADYWTWLVITPRASAVAGKGYSGTPTWINCGNSSYEGYAYAHELGHDLGLPHAMVIKDLATFANGVLTIPDLTVTTGGSRGNGSAGDDPSSTMGYQDTWAHFCGYEKAQLGWIVPERYLGGDKTYTLTPIEQAGGALYAVRVPMSQFKAGSVREYWIENRRADPRIFLPGIQVRVAGDFGCYTPSWINMVSLQPGQRFTDGTISIEVVADGVVRVRPGALVVFPPPPIIVQPTPPLPQPIGNMPVLTDIATIVQAAIAAGGKVTQAIKDAGLALWNQLVPDVVVAPPAGLLHSIGAGQSFVSSAGKPWSMAFDGMISTDYGRTNLRGKLLVETAAGVIQATGLDNIVRVHQWNGWNPPL